MEDFERPQDWESEVESDGSSPLGAAAGGRPPTHNYVMVGVSAEIAIAIAIASFVMGAALTGTLCYFLQFRKISAKMVRAAFSFFSPLQIRCASLLPLAPKVAEQ